MRDPPFEKIDRKDCAHEQLQFGSGDFYLFCHNCGAWWATIDENSQNRIAPERANIGVGSGLSGQWRKAVGGR